MKKLYLIPAIFIITFFVSITSCKEVTENSTSAMENSETGYDSLKAKEYGADEYGMKKYVMAFLKRGPNRPADSVKSAELQRAHLDNIGRLANEGKLVLAGPFFGNDDLRGIYIFDAASIDEAKSLTETDPAIQYGSLVMELKEWYGSAALMGLGKLHEQIQKKDI